MKREISMIIDVNLLAERIKLNRKNLGLSQKKFSVLIGTTQVTVLRHEKGERQPSEEILEKSLSFLEGMHVEKHLLPKFPILDKIKVGKRIYEIRKAYGLSLEKIGGLLTISAKKNVVCRWKIGKNYLTLNDC